MQGKPTPGESNISRNISMRSAKCPPDHRQAPGLVPKRPCLAEFEPGMPYSAFGNRHSPLMSNKVKVIPPIFPIKPPGYAPVRGP